MDLLKCFLWTLANVFAQGGIMWCKLLRSNPLYNVDKSSGQSLGRNVQGQLRKVPLREAKLKPDSRSLGVIDDSEPNPLFQVIRPTSQVKKILRRDSVLAADRLFEVSQVDPSLSQQVFDVKASSVDHSHLSKYANVTFYIPAKYIILIIFIFPALIKQSNPFGFLTEGLFIATGLPFHQIKDDFIQRPLHISVVSIRIRQGLC